MSNITPLIIRRIVQFYYVAFWIELIIAVLIFISLPTQLSKAAGPTAASLGSIMLFIVALFHVVLGLFFRYLSRRFTHNKNSLRVLLIGLGIIMFLRLVGDVINLWSPRVLATFFEMDGVEWLNWFLVQIIRVGIVICAVFVLWHPALKEFCRIRNAGTKL